MNTAGERRAGFPAHLSKTVPFVKLLGGWSELVQDGRDWFDFIHLAIRSNYALQIRATMNKFSSIAIQAIMPGSGAVLGHFGRI
jgi:hypothetical protein